MKDRDLRSFVTKLAYREGLPVVIDPEVIDPERFLHEVLTERFANPFVPDTPQRIATDTSQKLSVRFGETIKVYIALPDRDVTTLQRIPLVLAGWLRYLIGVDDKGNPFSCSPDPLLSVMQERLKGMELGEAVDPERLRSVLEDADVFGVDLYSCGLAEKVTAYFGELMAGEGAVRRALKKYA